MVTDNNPLTYVLTTAMLDATDHHWVAALSNYNFSLTYRSGKLNQDADGLSRLSEGQDQQVIYPEVLKAILNVSQTGRDELPLADSLLVCRSEQQIAADDAVPNDALKGSVMTSTDWVKGQSGDQTISRVKVLVPEVRNRFRKWQQRNIRMNILM